MNIAITADPEIPIPPHFYGGIERIIYMLIVELVNQGHDVTLFANKNSNVPCRLIPYPGNGQSLKDLLLNTYTITKAALTNKFDIIHSFGRLAYILPLMPFRIAKMMSYQREPTLKQVRIAMQLAKKNSMHFTGCSNYITNKIKNIAPASTVYNGVDLKQYSFNRELNKDDILVFLGRIEPIKGAHTAIDIARQTNRKLIIAGNIPECQMQYFNEKIKPFLNERITYIGPVNDQQKSQLLQKAYAFLMPIHWNEPFGIVMIEAMACGTPVLGISLGAVQEIVIDGVNGYTVNTFTQLIEKVDLLDKIDRYEVRKTVEERFSAQVITHEYLLTYRKLIDLAKLNR